MSHIFSSPVRWGQAIFHPGPTQGGKGGGPFPLQAAIFRMMMQNKSNLDEIATAAVHLVAVVKNSDNAPNTAAENAAAPALVCFQLQVVAGHCPCRSTSS